MSEEKDAVQKFAERVTMKYWGVITGREASKLVTLIADELRAEGWSGESGRSAWQEDE